MSSTDMRGAARLRGRVQADDPVLMSKVTVPELPGWAVARPRIEKLIEEGARSPLTSVTGPPGAGKTMAIASWAAARTNPGTLAWVTFDDFDNKRRVFWSYVVAALRRAGITVPRVLPGPTREAVEHVFLVRLASVLAAQTAPVVPYRSEDPANRVANSPIPIGVLRQKSRMLSRYLPFHSRHSGGNRPRS